MTGRKHHDLEMSLQFLQALYSSWPNVDGGIQALGFVVLDADHRVERPPQLAGVLLLGLGDEVIFVQTVDQCFVKIEYEGFDSLLDLLTFSRQGRQIHRPCQYVIFVRSLDTNDIVHTLNRVLQMIDEFSSRVVFFVEQPQLN